MRSKQKGGIIAAAAVLALLPAAAGAQQTTERFPVADPPQEARSPAIRVAKWTTLAASAGLATWGFITNARADDDYEAIERTCKAEPARCIDRTESGSYTDAELEARYQDVLSSDRHARVALIASQVGVAASVLLFIIDLKEVESPPNVPYEPRGLMVEPGREGVRIGMRVDSPI